ncbi:LIPOPROTEIN [Mycoplasmopsis pulmonis]|uniref:LIPOPROTEIN n=1 Tax=Mycoplasmopsis pulmonis (strain UAB CTIP) TaxID=272635 RepID=Q98QE7_MYCPU|nr:hypothetical protein [Mycoplasmopsis pulmonis]CAC13592.1 LIPOPROTEIN [Mycoplasmopsis pulmonis]
MRKKILITLLAPIAIVPLAVVSCTYDSDIKSRKSEKGQNGNNQQAQPDPSKPNANGSGSGSNQITPPPSTEPEAPKTPESPKPEGDSKQPEGKDMQEMKPD